MNGNNCIGHASRCIQKTHLDVDFLRMMPPSRIKAKWWWWIFTKVRNWCTYLIIFNFYAEYNKTSIFSIFYKTYKFIEFIRWFSYHWTITLKIPYKNPHYSTKNVTAVTSVYVLCHWWTVTAQSFTKINLYFMAFKLPSIWMVLVVFIYTFFFFFFFSLMIQDRQWDQKYIQNMSLVAWQEHF